ncbi:MAG: glycosyltransferase family protein [Thermoleophilia bacterium]
MNDEPLRINFISQIDPFRNSGGGEMMNRSLIEAGRRHGHQIKVTAAYPEPVTDLFDHPDLVILADVHNQPSARSRLDPALVEGVIEESPYIHLDNAYVDVCDLPYLPCGGDSDGRACPYKRSLRTQAHRLLRRRGCLAARTRRMYENARLNVFVSGLHRRTVAGILGPDAVGAFLETPPTVDSTEFVDHRNERDINNLYVGALSDAKGLGTLRERFGDDITLIGPSPSGSPPGFGNWLGQLPYAEIPAYMNRARNFAFLPRWPEPCGRVVIEAALCGCHLVTNENVGALGFVDGFLSGRTTDAAAVFWREAAACLE